MKFHEDNDKKIKIEEFFEKIYSTNEISNDFILSCNVKDYIQRLCCKEIPKLIKKDIKNFFCQNI